jgi:hypothetical protein
MLLSLGNSFTFIAMFYSLAFYSITPSIAERLILMRTNQKNQKLLFNNDYVMYHFRFVLFSHWQFLNRGTYMQQPKGDPLLLHIDWAVFYDSRMYQGVNSLQTDYQN